MRGRFRPPALAVAAALLGLIALLATLQYRWLGRISDAERERMTTTLTARANAFALDFDRELTLAYMLFQVEPGLPGAEPEPDPPARLASHYDRWQATARYPKLIRDVYVASRETDAAATLQRFNPATRRVEAVEWPGALAPIRAQLAETREEKSANGTIVVRTMTSALWEGVPALVVPHAMGPVLFFSNATAQHGARRSGVPSIAYLVLLLDRQVITAEMLPALAAQHFREESENIRYQLAVVDTTGSPPVYQSTREFAPTATTRSDANAGLFQVRPQEFPQLIADVRRFTALTGPGGAGTNTQTVTTFTMPVERHATVLPGPGVRGEAPPTTMSKLIVRDGRPPSAMLGQFAAARDRAWITAVSGGRPGMAPKWRLLIKHPAGSLEAAVDSVRRRNLMISTSILGVLAASMMLMVASMRRSQALARQQMEFVATVSHELRTPLAVVRAAGDNLAEGVIQDEAQVRKYGELVRNEGRRLTEMVEQILELAGMHSGQRTLHAVPVRVDALVAGVLRASDSMIESARLEIEVDISADLPPVLGDEAALRRALQNLIGNAIKYGADGGWIGIVARRAGGAEVSVTVSDRGIGIAPADQARIFEPFYRAADVVSAQVQGAGLGLSLVQRTVLAHGGRISVKSAKGAGSQFTIYLPAASEQAIGQPSSVGTGATAPASHLS
jgi:signal transduction histidine kinase